MRNEGRLSKPFTEVVVVPMTLRSCNPGSSCLWALVGERGAVALKKGECEGVKRKAGWLILSRGASVVVYCARASEDGASWVAGPSLHRVSGCACCCFWNVRAAGWVIPASCDRAVKLIHT